MACFTAPLAQALVVTAAKSTHGGKIAHSRNPFVSRIGWLQKMLFGGSLLLAVEHIWHGEITFSYPFLTAVKDGTTAEMWHEILTVGVAMAVVITAAWAVLVLAAESLAHRHAAASERA